MDINTPLKIVELAGEAAIEKEKYSVKKTLILSFLAGAYIAFGGLLAVIIGGGSPELKVANPGLVKFLYGAAFPVGLMLVVLAGAELFTGNNAYFMPNVLSKKQKWTAPLRNWSLVYIGNFIGSIFVAYFLVHLTDIVSIDPWKESIISVAEAKVSQPFYVIFLKAIGANWLVCLALWLGMSAKQMSGKILGIWWPVMVFVTLGFEHSIANMFFIPAGIFEGANVSWVAFAVDNLIPATLGNIVGGAFFVGTLYWWAYKKLK